ncbi:transposase [Clostridium estertheticum]|uniref:transposase n=1 Tax=Clostridium estertheticum TaxID=238834 RepID=UPI0035CC514D
MVGLQPTGHYWFTFGNFLKELGIKLVLVNPFHVKRSKELDDNSQTKNDLKDPKTIAKLVIEGRYSLPCIPEEIYSALRIAMGMRESLTKNLSIIKNKVDHWLDKYFPEFEVLAFQVPGVKEMVSMKGVGIMTAAGFIAEVSDIKRFTHPSQIPKLAGLNLIENSSGKHKDKTSISNRVRARLRALLFRVIMPLVSKNKEFKMLHEYYTNRKVIH